MTLDQLFDDLTPAHTRGLIDIKRRHSTLQEQISIVFHPSVQPAATDKLKHYIVQTYSVQAWFVRAQMLIVQKLK